MLAPLCLGSLALAGVVMLPGCVAPPPATGVTAVPGPFGDEQLRRELRGGDALAEPAAVTAAPTRPAYLIQHGDELDVQFAEQPSHDQSVRVRPDGKITLKLVGPVFVAGRTAEDVEAELRERYQALAGGIGERAYLIRAGDELEVKFPYNPQLNEVLKVRPDGKLMLPLAGTVAATGRSPEELQAELERRYARVLRKPQVAVVMRSFNSQTVRVGQGANQVLGRSGAELLRPSVTVRNFTPDQVFVGGEVARAGVLPLRPGLTLMQALVQAGGQLPSAELRAATVLRRVPGREPLVIRRDLSVDLRGQGTQDIVLEPADIVLLPRSGIATLADNLNQYLFNLVPFTRNSSFGFAYELRK